MQIAVCVIDICPGEIKFMSEGNIISVPVLLIMIVVIIIGYLLVNYIVNKKWGYTEKREKELENTDETDFMKKLDRR